MSLRTALVGVFALVFALAAAVGIYLISRGRTAKPTTEMVAVIVAKVDISRGQSLSADLLVERPWPKDALPDGAITEMQAAVERAVLIPVAKGELMLEVKLASKGAGRGMAALVPPGMRAVAIQTPNISTGVAGFILPGNKVDVLLTVSSPGMDDLSGGGTTFTLLQNVEILAVDQRIEAPQENKMDPKELRSVTLMVTPADAAKLDLGQNRGTLQLALRNPADDAIQLVEPATLIGLSGKPPVNGEVFLGVTGNGAAAQTATGENDSNPPPVFRRVRTLRGLQSGVIDFPPAIADRDGPPKQDLDEVGGRLSNSSTTAPRIP